MFDDSNPHNYLLNYANTPLNLTHTINSKKLVGNNTIYNITLKLNNFPFTKIAKCPNNHDSWTHTILIYVPLKITNNTFFLKVGSGKANDKHKYNEMFLNMSKKLSMVFIELFDVPNQPLIFKNTNIQLCEDDLMAFSWKSYIDSHNIDHIINFHMVKSVVETMNFCDSFSKKYLNITNQKYVLCGASKRGLTVWLTSSVDQRVQAIIPMVYDLLNTKIALRNQQNKLGKFTEKLASYVKNELFGNLLDHHLFNIIDPLNYDKYIKIPKFIINAGNDNFFTPDSSTFYFESIKGTKYLRYMPNTNHNLETNLLPSHLKNIIKMIISDKIINHNINNNNNLITITADEKIKMMNVWYAQNEYFDFGMQHYIPYKCININDYIDSGKININDILTKTNVWLVYMIEIIFDNDFVISSPIYIY